MALTHIEKLIAKAVHDYGMIQEGDRILIGASGGKDSTLLAWALSRRRIWNAPRFELAALRIASDVPGGGLDPAAAEHLADLYARWNIPLETMDVPVIGRLKEGRSMNCYWCATQRRTELIRYAMERGYNKIALGHHLDDILATLLMNMVKKGETAAMVPRLKYDKYPIEIIRPLALVTERSIIAFAAREGWLSRTCTCAYGSDRERKKYQDKLDALTSGKEEEKRNLYRSLSNIKSDYLPKP
ncbi:tRNA 2-thiocytidine biosynthesis TtcA family protein [Treponema sp. OttesenSCG-928-L16]|nr:tRNA 2-thiocytidine biosynthesis TtcA family protein [Treponema sp. OttesenSCG-928-L16]